MNTRPIVCVYPLSEREREIFLLATRYTNKEVAVLLGISHQTVKNHLTNVYRKLGALHLTDGVVMAIRLQQVEIYDFPPVRETARVRRVKPSQES